MHEMMRELANQRRQELLREAERDHLAKALRGARKRRDGKGSAVAWETKRHAGRLAKLLKRLRFLRRLP